MLSPFELMRWPPPLIFFPSPHCPPFPPSRRQCAREARLAYDSATRPDGVRLRYAEEQRLGRGEFTAVNALKVGGTGPLVGVERA